MAEYKAVFTEGDSVTINGVLLPDGTVLATFDPECISPEDHGFLGGIKGTQVEIVSTVLEMMERIRAVYHNGGNECRIK